MTKVAATQIKTFSDNVPMLTSDENIVQVDFNVQYRVSDPQLYLFGTRDADADAQQAAQSTVREQVGRSDLDTVLGARERARGLGARSSCRSRSTPTAPAWSSPNSTCPTRARRRKCKPAFDDVNSAQQDKDRLTSEAQAYAAKIVPEARGEAARVRTVAEGYKTAAIARATGDAERFTLLVDQYRTRPKSPASACGWKPCSRCWPTTARSSAATAAS